jgi:glycosyltransferase involved in cell wall biosynthesis
MAKKRLSVSIILPCLNEEASITKCIRDAKRSAVRFPHEIIVVDNGSTDASATLAKKAGANVVYEPVPGYGAALQTGIKKSHGEFIVIADADGTYDFSTISQCVRNLNHGADLVLGSRLSGVIDSGAMPFSHRYIGTPFLTFLINLSYFTHLTDAQTGQRAFSKFAYNKMNLKSQGMEFASEMIVKALIHHMKISEIPISYHKRVGISKLEPLSDAWRHIKFILLYAPSYLFFVPGFCIFLYGLSIKNILPINLGIQITLLGLMARQYTKTTLDLPSGPLATYLLNIVTTERLLITGFAIGFIGLFTSVGFIILGTQILFSAILYGLLGEK